MRKLLFILIISITFTSAANSQTEKYDIDVIKKELELTNEQYELLKDLNLASKAVYDDIYYEKLHNILNIDQRNKFKEIYNVDLSTYPQNKTSNVSDEKIENEGIEDLEESGIEPHEDKRVDDRDIKVAPPLR